MHPHAVFLQARSQLLIIIIIALIISKLKQHVVALLNVTRPSKVGHVGPVTTALAGSL